MDSDNESIEEIEIINRSLLPLNPNSNNGQNTSNNNTNSNRDASSLPIIHPLIFLLRNRNITQEPDDDPKDIQKPLDYLSQLTEPIEQVIEDVQTIQSLIEINEIARKNKEKINFIIDYKLHVLLKELVQFEYQILHEYVEKGEFNIERENTSPKFTTFHLTCDLIEILVVSSKEFASLFHMIGGTKCFLSFFSDRNLIQFMIKSFTKSDPFKNQRKMELQQSTRLSSQLTSLSEKQPYTIV